MSHRKSHRKSEPHIAFAGTSAPSSPAKSRESLLQRVQSLTGAARDQGANLVSAAASTVSRVQAFNKDRCFTLLVIDDQNTDWSKYFRGKRLHGMLMIFRKSIVQLPLTSISQPGDYDIRVEQAEFSEISVVASGEAGATVSIVSYRTGAKVICKSSLNEFNEHKLFVLHFLFVCRRRAHSGPTLCWCVRRLATAPKIIARLCWDLSSAAFRLSTASTAFFSSK